MDAAGENNFARVGIAARKRPDFRPAFLVQPKLSMGGLDPPIQFSNRLKKLDGRLGAGHGEVYRIAFCRFSSTLSRKPSVVSHFCSGPTRSARSLVMSPSSTVATQTCSSVCANLSSCGLLSSLARWLRPRVQAKIEAMELVEVALPY